MEIFLTYLLAGWVVAGYYADKAAGTKQCRTPFTSIAAILFPWIVMAYVAAMPAPAPAEPVWADDLINP